MTCQRSSGIGPPPAYPVGTHSVETVYWNRSHARSCLPSGRALSAERPSLSGLMSTPPFIVSQTRSRSPQVAIPARVFRLSTKRTPGTPTLRESDVGSDGVPTDISVFCLRSRFFSSFQLPRAARLPSLVDTTMYVCPDIRLCLSRCSSVIDYLDSRLAEDARQTETGSHPGSWCTSGLTRHTPGRDVARSRALL